MTDPGPFAALELDGKVVVVTGAANGIGATTAGVLTERGATVERLDRTGGPAIVECDVTDEARIADVVAEVALRHGRIDALVNVAGIGLIKSLAETTPEAWRRVVEVNLTGPFLMARATIDHLIESGGSIVNVASVSGIHAQPLISAYGASKGGLVQLTRILAVEFAQAGVRVNAVCPGGVDTQLTAGVRDDLRRVADRVVPAAMHRFHPLVPGRVGADEVGEAIAYLISDAARSITGATMVIDRGTSSS